jgi:hypothetical protein
MLFQVFLIQKSCLSCRVSHEDSALLRGLDVGLEIAPNAITDSHVGKVAGIENVAMESAELQQFVRETIIVLLLLNRVVECRVTKVLFAIGHQETFELSDRSEVL